MRERPNGSAETRRDGRPKGGGLAPWLLAAGALHAALLLVWVAESARSAPLAHTALKPPSEPGGELGWVELEQVSSGELSRVAEPSAPSTRGKPRAPAAGPALAAAARGAPSLHAAAPLLPSPSSPPPAAEAPAGEASGEGAAAQPRLSLEALGVGARHNPFLSPPPQPPLRSVLNQRVQQMLKGGLAARDQEVGLGPEGPAVALAEKIVLDSATQPNTSALLLIRTDGAGIASHVEVLEAANETQGWERIAAELKRELAKTPLRIPSGSAGVSFQLRIVSRVQLPSGADPGLAVELFGQTIKEGGGDRSSRISVLSPKLVVTEVAVPYSDGAIMPMVGFSPNILSGSGDLADIGAVARRVVRAHLVALETHVGQAEGE